MEHDCDPAIQTFFEDFERFSANNDAQALAALYAESFVTAGAAGVQVVKAADLPLLIPKRKQMLETVGHRSTRLVSVRETKLDERHSMVRTAWKWRFEPAGAEANEITLESTVIVRRSGDGLRIVFYLNHEDILTALRGRGMLRG